MNDDIKAIGNRLQKLKVCCTMYLRRKRVFYDLMMAVMIKESQHTIGASFKSSRSVLDLRSKRVLDHQMMVVMT